jgi:hypothetical protein
MNRRTNRRMNRRTNRRTNHRMNREPPDMPPDEPPDEPPDMPPLLEYLIAQPLRTRTAPSAITPLQIRELIVLFRRIDFIALPPWMPVRLPQFDPGFGDWNTSPRSTYV